jgi:hypothetical protein
MDGERVVLTVAGDGQPADVSRGPAPVGGIPSPANDPKVETVFQFNAGQNSAAPDQLVASFRNFGGPGAVLKIENGFSHPVIYDAFIIAKRGQDLAIAPTSICPVAAGKIGVESWDGSVRGIIIAKVREPPGDEMRCSGQSGLSGASTSVEPNVCMGGAPDAPVQVQLRVDPATGKALGAQVEWRLRDAAGGQWAPTLTLYFPMQGEQVGGLPVSAVVGALAPDDPAPSAKAASIVLIADGVEAVRRPWRMYAQRRSQDADVPAGAKPVAFFGAIPFPLRAQNGDADPQMAALFAAIGEGKVRQLEVKVEGDDGTIIGQAKYALSPSPVRDQALVSAALRDAEAKAAAPGHCARPKDSR